MRYLERLVVSNRPILIITGLLVCCSATGCHRPGPLVIRNKQPHYAPWCGANVRVRIGKRVVGHVHDGPKHKDFLVDESGKEHDPDKIASEAWSYLERTGDGRKIKEAFVNEAIQSTMPVVSINPVVILLVTHTERSWLDKDRSPGHERWFWRAQIQPNSDAQHCREKLLWFSPELKQAPRELKFSDGGVAEIPLPNGTLKVVREGDSIKTTRE